MKKHGQIAIGSLLLALSYVDSLWLGNNMQLRKPACIAEVGTSNTLPIYWEIPNFLNQKIAEERIQESSLFLMSLQLQYLQMNQKIGSAYGLPAFGNSYNRLITIGNTLPQRSDPNIDARFWGNFNAKFAFQSVLSARPVTGSRKMGMQVQNVSASDTTKISKPGVRKVSVKPRS